MFARILGFAFVLFLIGGLPVLSHLSTRQDDLLLLPRKSLYFSAAASQWLLAIITVLVIVATSEKLAVFKVLAAWSFVKWTAAVATISLAGLALALVLERYGWWPEESRWVEHLIPRTREEKLWSLLVLAPTAGFCEELIYRGYLLAQLTRYFHSVDAAWAVSSVAFGLAHTYQKFDGAVRAALLGALLAYPVVRLGSLYPSIAAHFLIDAVALVWLGPVSLREKDHQL
ncbi:MAG TPA: type II CAAX endopeptidase family protein [Terriglobia bacterium]|nr:type II CAAX endopeptidase family protein [Terriglobia bacterium]